MPLNDCGNVFATIPKATATASMSSSRVFRLMKSASNALFHILIPSKSAANIQNSRVPTNSLTPLMMLENSPGLPASLTKLPGANTSTAVPSHSDAASIHVLAFVFRRFSSR